LISNGNLPLRNRQISESAQFGTPSSEYSESDQSEDCDGGLDIQPSPGFGGDVFGQPHGTNYIAQHQPNQGPVVKNLLRYNSPPVDHTYGGGPGFTQYPGIPPRRYDNPRVDKALDNHYNRPTGNHYWPGGLQKQFSNQLIPEHPVQPHPVMGPAHPASRMDLASHPVFRASGGYQNSRYQPESDAASFHRNAYLQNGWQAPASRMQLNNLAPFASEGGWPETMPPQYLGPRNLPDPSSRQWDTYGYFPH